MIAMTKMTFGKGLKIQREAAGMTQRELAAACGWNADTGSRVGNYESGSREPKLSEITRLAEALRCPIVKLIPGAWEDLVTRGFVVEDPQNPGRAVLQDLFNTLPPRSQRALVAAAKAMADEESS
jgi:transcriptional regulator with XRE-family HTH domain